MLSKVGGRQRRRSRRRSGNEEKVSQIVKSYADESFERLRPSTSLSKTSGLSNMATTPEEEEEMGEVPFLPALALPDSPTPPPSRW